VLADGLRRISAANPSVVAIDLILSDPGDQSEDAEIAAALANTPHLVLASEIIPRSAQWEEPLKLFARHAAAIGHVHAGPDPVSRTIPLREVADAHRRWALALEAFRIATGGQPVTESLDQLQIGSTIIPVRRGAQAALAIRYLQPQEDGTSRIPFISLGDLKHDP
jgi:CHASE2 domain-containing sensor protein